MHLSKLPLAAALALTTFALALPASAQTKTTEQADGYIYDFVDDYMVGDTLSTTPALLKLRPDAARATLLRPRASFVPEMLKSIELM